MAGLTGVPVNGIDNPAVVFASGIRKIYIGKHVDCLAQAGPMWPR